MGVSSLFQIIIILILKKLKKRKKRKKKEKRKKEKKVGNMALGGEYGWSRGEDNSTLSHIMLPANVSPVPMVSSQFGAFHFGARQFGAFHFDAVPVRRVSLWRDASLARFTLARFPFLCLTAQKCFLCQFGTISFCAYVNRVCE